MKRFLAAVDTTQVQLGHNTHPFLCWFAYCRIDVGMPASWHWTFLWLQAVYWCGVNVLCRTCTISKETASTAESSVCLSVWQLLGWPSHSDWCLYTIESTGINACQTVLLRSLCLGVFLHIFTFYVLVIPPHYATFRRNWISEIWLLNSHLDGGPVGEFLD